MRNKKRTIFTSVVLALALSLSACAADPDDTDDTVDPGNGDVTTTLLPVTTTTIP
jgi:starvation-inducible outer membrane lipoprotein